MSSRICMSKGNPMFRSVATLSILYAALVAAEVSGADLSMYRQFQLGSTLEAVTRQVGVTHGEAKTLHRRPAVIQEMAWQPQYQSTSRASQDPVDQVLFSFSDRKLFQIVVIYNRTSTKGLTDDDIIERVSAQYGAPDRPPNAEMMFPTMFKESAKVIARWEDQRSTVNAVHSADQATFGLILVSKELEPAARTATAEAVRLDRKEAPEREADLETQRVEQARVKEEQSRRTNKPNFRP
jgi:hypothetical protein